MRRPKIGQVVRVHDAYDEPHVCTVIDLLDMQFTCTYEVLRDDGGWRERTLFIFYSNDWKIVD